MEQCGGRLKTNGLVKSGIKIPDWPVHDDHRRALAHADNVAKPFVETDDIPGTKPERTVQCLPEDSELGLVGANEDATLDLANRHTQITANSGCKRLASMRLNKR